MSLGDFTAFNSYLAILIFPVIMIGFMSNVMAQAGASYERICAACSTRPAPKASGTHRSPIFAATSRSRHVVVKFGEQGRAQGRVARRCRPAPGPR